MCDITLVLTTTGAQLPLTEAEHLNHELFAGIRLDIARPDYELVLCRYPAEYSVWYWQTGSRTSTGCTHASFDTAWHYAVASRIHDEDKHMFRTMLDTTFNMVKERTNHERTDN